MFLLQYFVMLTAITTNEANPINSNPGLSADRYNRRRVCEQGGEKRSKKIKYEKSKAI